jgi:hypothetical protein
MKYKKHISMKYKYVDSVDSEKALAEVFDDIFMRLVKIQQEEIYTKFSPLTAIVFGSVLEHKRLYIDN